MQKSAADTPGFDVKSDSNYLGVLNKKLRLEYMLSTEVRYMYES